MTLTHEEATQMLACSRYLSGDLSEEESAAFEEHYFTCPECTEELAAAVVFAENLRAVFAADAKAATLAQSIVPISHSRWYSRSEVRRALPFAAAACLLLGVVLYQNIYTISNLRQEVAALSEPQSLPEVTLKLDREAPVEVASTNRFWVARFRLPKPSEFPAYECDIKTSAGQTLKTVPLVPPQSGEPFSILMPRSEFRGGVYLFHVRAKGSSHVIAPYTANLR